MRAFLGCLIIVIASFGGAVALAQSADPAPKIAVLNLEEALLSSDRAIAVDERLQTETARDQEKMKNLETQAIELNTRLQQDAEILSEAEQMRILGNFEEIQNQYQYLMNKVQALVNERQQQFQQANSADVLKAINDVVDEEDIDIVVRADALINYSSFMDITALVTAKLNEQ